ncbi:VPS35 endosomal protein sorting factor like [Cricetulus griseus]
MTQARIFRAETALHNHGGRGGAELPGHGKRGGPPRTSGHVTEKMAVFPWHSRNRNYKAELASCRLETVPLECGDYHPLKPITVTESKTKKVNRKGSTSSTSSSSSSSVVDPLSSVLDGTDPLSMFAATSDPAASGTVTDSSRKKRDKDDSSFVGPDFEPWANKRGEILARYTTTEKLSINLFMGSEKGKAGAMTSAMSEKVRTRLEELDDFEEGSQKELLNLTQQDYVSRIEELNQSLKDAWASDQKVKALKIVIQIISFPYLEVLHQIGHTRVNGLSYSLSSVQSCYQTRALFSSTQANLSSSPTSSIRSVGMEVAPHLKESLNKNFFDFLLTFKQIHGDTVQNQLVAQGVELLSYLPLYSPAMGWIFQCVSYHAPEHLLFRSLGLNLALADPPENDRLQILNEAWKVITKLKNPQLQSIIKKVIAHFHDFSVLFSVEKFLPFLDMFQKESVRVEVCKCIMEAFIKHQQEPTKDPVILNALMHICKTMHDSVNALTLEDEKRMLAHLINGFIKMVSFGRDFEQQLSFYVESRSMFCNLEPVLVQLIHSVNRLAMETRKVMKGNHSRKTAAFVRACVAYCFITIPSLVGIFTRLNLYLHSGQVALANQCLSQADAFFKAAIGLIPEVPKTISIDGKLRPSEPFLLEFLCNFFSTLLIVPDHPEHGVLFLVRELLNVIQDYTWEDNSDDKIRIYTSVLHLLSAMSQDTYLYHIDKVDSNDSLYGGDSKFLAENSKLCEAVMAQILEHLKTLAKDEALKRQSSLGLSFFNSILAHGDLRNNKLNQLSVNLWHLAQRHGCADTRTMVKTLDYIKKRSKQPDMNHLTELALRLPLQTRT